MRRASAVQSLLQGARPCPGPLRKPSPRPRLPQQPWAAPRTFSRPFASLIPKRCGARGRNVRHAASAGTNELAPWRCVEGGAFTGGKCDAVIILAGGQLRDGTLPEWVTRRVDRAAELWRERGSVVICSGGGTPHKPPILNPQGFVVHEAVSCAQYLMERGVPASAILREVSSYDTIGNAYFSIVIHALPRGFRRLCVVTSEFHMPRSRAIFEELCRMAAPAAAPGGTAGPGGVFELEYVSVSDDGVFDDEVLRAREEREAKSLRTWREGGGAIGSLGEFSQWLHETHLCYAVSRQHELGRPTAVDDKALASY